MNDSIKKLSAMCADLQFDPTMAETLIQRIELNQDIPDLEYPTLRTSFLTEATRHANIEMLKLLLKNGADPNYILYHDKPGHRENAFWDLQYNDFGETAAENEIGLQMAQLMLTFGADPNKIILDGEDLLSDVCYEVFAADDNPATWEYRSRFLILMVAYGASNAYCQPKIYKAFDKSNLAQYRFVLVPCDDGYHYTGEILDNNSTIVGKI